MKDPDGKSSSERTKLAYFSMEIGLTTGIPTYAGGSGILAGDTVRLSADSKLLGVAITLVSKKRILQAGNN